METGRDTTSALLARNYALAHKRVLDVVEELSPEQFGRSIHPAVHSIGWQVWHIARWDDRFAEILLERFPEIGPPNTRGQIWADESVGMSWGLPAGTMGVRDTGTSMADVDAEQVRLPAKAEVVAYARQVFARLDELAKALPDEVLLAVMPGDPDLDTTAENVLIYLEHASRHLGTIEALKGQLGLKGSATR
jgi:hypothetical protein